MCARYTLSAPDEVLVKLFHLHAPEGAIARYNIAPTQPVLGVRENKEGDRELKEYRWGLVPYWAKNLSIGQKLINARAETLAEKPAFRSAAQRRRCLIPADGFYEWRSEGKLKMPVYVQLTGGDPFCFAGLYERWKSPEGNWIESCALVTTEPNELVAELHDRMPVILTPEQYDLWLDRSIDSLDPLRGLLVPYPAEEMRTIPVSRYVNDPNHEGPECVEPAA